MKHSFSSREIVVQGKNNSVFPVESINFYSVRYGPLSNSLFLFLKLRPWRKMETERRAEFSVLFAPVCCVKKGIIL